MKVKLHISWFIDMSGLTQPSINVCNFAHSITSEHQFPGGWFEIDLPVVPPTEAEAREYQARYLQEARLRKIAEMTASLAEMKRYADEGIQDAYEQTHPAYTKEELE